MEKAKAGLRLAEEKLRAVKRSLLHLEKETQPRLNQLEHLRWILRTNLPGAVLQLNGLVQRLEEYASPALGGSSAPVRPPAEAGPREKEAS